MVNSEFQYKAPFNVTDRMKESFQENGYVLIRGLLEKDELQRVRGALAADNEIYHNAFITDDGEGRKSRATVWSYPGNDLTGMISRSQRVAGTAADLLGGEVYHYHSKLMMKEARTGGKFVWHQDYGQVIYALNTNSFSLALPASVTQGALPARANILLAGQGHPSYTDRMVEERYWYQNGILNPDMISVFIAIDKCEKANGCLQILEGSNKCGRIDHGRVGGQTGADVERVEKIKEKLPLKYVELEEGDALFFHCNVLHTSSANTSDRRRWVFISCYNKATNNPVKEHHFPCYNKLDIVSDDSIRKCTNFTDMSGKKFMKPEDNKTIVATKA